jgi:NAD(P)-dependent dehydrogenase (short-subunit alcohol dehydrogenase family)
MGVFRAQGAGHLVLISSVASVRGMPGTRTAYGASKAAVNALAEGIRSDVWGTGITVTTILPGYIATDINVGRRGPMTVDLDKGVDALTAAVEREPVKAYVPGWPWTPVAPLLRVLPLSVVRRLTGS